MSRCISDGEDVWTPSTVTYQGCQDCSKSTSSPLESSVMTSSIHRGVLPSLWIFSSAVLKLDLRTSLRDKPSPMWWSSRRDPLSATSNRELESNRATAIRVKSSRLLLVVVVMLGTRVVAARIVVALVADRRKSFTGATMVNFWLFARLIFQSCLFSNLSQTSCLFKFIYEFVSRPLIVQPRPRKYYDFAILVLAVLFCFVLFLP